MNIPQKRERRAPDQFREWLEVHTKNVSRAYDLALEASRNNEQVAGQEPWDYYEMVKQEELADQDPVLAMIEGSERTTLVIGSTFQGEFIYSDRTGVVVQIQPEIHQETQPIAQTANANELKTISTASDRGEGKFFAPVYDMSSDGCWIIREYCTPIYKPDPDSYRPHHDYLSWHTMESHIQRFIETFEDCGYEGSYTDGNIGLTQTNNIVLLDAGTHTETPS